MLPPDPTVIAKFIPATTPRGKGQRWSEGLLVRVDREAMLVHDMVATKDQLYEVVTFETTLPAFVDSHL